MIALRFAIRSLMRDWHSGELRLITIAIIIAVTGLTTVGFFTDRVQRATEAQAGELLAADLIIRSGDPVSRELVNRAHAAGLVTTRTTSFRSVITSGEKLELAEIKAVEDGYPIRGQLRTAPVLFGEESVTGKLPAPGSVWIDSRLFQALDIAMGDTIQLGEARFNVERILTYEPDRGGDLFNIAPRLLMNREDVEKTGLIQPASRVAYRLLLGGDGESIRRFREAVEKMNDPSLRVQDIRDARPELRTALERAEQFLGLAALISIALAGLAVAMSSQRYAVRHFDHCAIMRCLGSTQSDIFRYYAIQLFILALAGSALGCLAGYIAQAGLSGLLSGMIQGDLPPAGLLPIAQGMLAGLITVGGFAVPQILRLRHISPLRVLRRDLTPLPVSGLTLYFLAVIALALLTPWQSGELRLTLYTFGGLFVTGIVMLTAARLAIVFLNRQRHRFSMAIRFGVANLARRKRQTTAEVIGIGLGVTVMLLLTLVRTDLLDNWRDRVPPDAPNFFLINIQPDAIDQVSHFLDKHLATGTALYPMIRARLVAINDEKIDPENYADDRARRLATREFNLSWTEAPQKDNRLVAGQWWKGLEKETLFSVEEGIAGELGIKLGDRLTYQIAGETISGRVTSLRAVEWDSFNVNFFVVANPGSINDYPATWITSFHLPSGKKIILNDLVRSFPSITVLDVDALLREVRRIMNRVIKTVEYVFGFTLLAGLVILIAALQTTHDERLQEAAVFSALGANRRRILTSLVAEFLCLGLLAGVISAFTATLLELLLAHYVFRMNIVINPWLWLLAPLICTAIIVVVGLAGTRHILNSPPMLTLQRV